MTPNNYKSAIRDERRRRVARLRLRGLTQREIMAGLAEQGILNPDTGAAYELGTINRDLKAIEAEWKSEAVGDIAQHKGNHLAELKETRRVAWADKKGPKLFYVLKSLEQEARVLGLDDPDPGEDIARKARVYMDLLEKAQADALLDMSE